MTPDTDPDPRSPLLDTLRQRSRQQRSAGPNAGTRIGDPATGEDAIRLERVGLAFGDNQVLRDVSFTVHRGETFCILGGSGAGKSTILRLILLLALPDSGRVTVEGREMSTASLEEVLKVRERMGMVFQAAALFDSLSVYDNVAFPLWEHTALEDDAVDRRVREVLTFVDLEPEDVVDLLPAELSGGMKKRVAIARAIAHEPEILLFDEPTSGLDPITTRTINQLILKLGRELGVTTVAVTHDIRSAFTIGDRVALLHAGQIVFMGTPEEMMESEDQYVQNFLR